MGDALTDPLKRWDPTSQELAYNNLTDRLKVELPEYSDASASGVVTDSVDAAGFMHKYVPMVSNTRNGVLWTPTSGKAFVITDLIINAASAGTVNVFDNTNVAANQVVQLTMGASTTMNHPFRKPQPSSAVNNVLKYDTYGPCSGFITVNGYEI